MALTVAGNEITDALRALGIQGDGLSGDSSFGIWDAATNLIRNGGAETNITDWGVWLGSAGTPARSTAQSKFGGASIQLTGMTADYAGLQNSNFAPVVSTIYAASLWFRPQTSGTYHLNVGDGPSNWLASSASKVCTAGVWTRFTVIITPTTTTNLAFAMWKEGGGTFVGETVYLDGFQVEQAKVASPYIHTDGATATRNGGRVQLPAGLIGLAQGWVAFRVRMGWPSGSPPVTAGMGLFILGDGAGDRIYLWNAGSVWTMSIVTAGVTKEADFSVAAWAAGDVLTIIGKWTGSAVTGSRDGGAFPAGTAYSGTPAPTPTLADLGSFASWFGGGSSRIDADILWAAGGAGALSNTDAATIHGFGDAGPSAPTLLPGSPSFYWAAATAGFATVRTMSDTGASISDSVVTQRGRKDADTGAAISETLVRKVTRPISQTGATISDSIISSSVHTSRAVSDTGVSFSTALVAHKLRTYGLGDTGALVNDAIGGVTVVEMPGKLGIDSYADGTSTVFGSFTPIADDFSVFADVFEPYVPPLTETESYYARLPFLEAETKLSETRPVAGTARHVYCSWHGMITDPERGAFVLVRAGGRLEDLIGERVLITAQRGRASRGRSSVVGFVHGVADLDPRDEVSLTRRLFMGISLVGNDRVPVVVERLS